MPLPIREHWEEVVQELAAVGSVPPGPECEEADTSLSLATRFLHHLKEELFPIHFNFIVDSDRDYLHSHSPSQTVTHTLQLGDLQPLFTPITQISALFKERDPNDDTPTPSPPLQELIPSQQLLYGESLDRWCYRHYIFITSLMLTPFWLSCFSLLQTAPRECLTVHLNTASLFHTVHDLFTLTHQLNLFAI